MLIATQKNDHREYTPVWHDIAIFDKTVAFVQKTGRPWLCCACPRSDPLKPLLGFEGVIHNGFQRGILFSFEDYLELVDCTGRISRDDKRGAIDEKTLPILERLNLVPGRWCERAKKFEDTYQDYLQSRRRRAA